MKSSPPTEEIYRSSSFDQNRSSPADEVSILVATALHVKRLHPLVDTFVNDHKDLFLQVLERQVHLLQTRSQAFEDGHITVYDKTLLALTQNGNHLEHPAAIHFYCEEYLGINNVGDPDEIQKSLSQTIELQQRLKHAHLHQGLDPKPVPSSKQGESTSLTQKSDLEAQFRRLWEVYEKAKTDFAAVPDDDKSATAISNAKFLRDTAENTLDYLKDKKVDSLMIAELNGTYQMAKQKVVELNGGKKRKFDCTEKTSAKNGSRGSNNLCRKDHSYSKARGQASNSHGKNISPRARGRGHSGIPYGYTRAVDSYQPY